jgi:hypothetical protein
MSTNISKKRKADAPAAVADGGAPLRACSLCLNHQHSTTEKFRCDACGMNSALPFEHEINVYLRALMAPSAPAAPTSSTLAPVEQRSRSANKLSKRDEEFRRLAQDGVPYPLFEDGGKLTSEEAFALGRNSFLATDYAPPSAWLKALAASGKLTQPGFALPVPLGQAVREREQQGDALLILRDGRVTQSGTEVAPPLKNMTDLVIAFASTIGPAIIQKPAALANWFALLHSTAMVEKDSNSWPAARKFLHDTLADSAYRRVPFALYDTRIIDAVERWVRAQEPELESSSALLDRHRASDSSSLSQSDHWQLARPAGAGCDNSSKFGATRGNESALSLETPAE